MSQDTTNTHSEIAELEQIFSLDSEDKPRLVHYLCDACERFPCSILRPVHREIPRNSSVKVTCPECELMNRLASHEAVVCRKCGAPW